MKKLIFCKAKVDIKAGQELVVDEVGNARPVTYLDLRVQPVLSNKDAHGVEMGLKRALSIVRTELGMPLLHPIAAAALDRLRQKLEYEIDNGPLSSAQMKEGA